MTRARKALIVRNHKMTDPHEDRRDRALALMLASVSLKGSFNMESLLGVADEFLQYIQGDDSAAIPRPDAARKRAKR